MSEIVAKYAAWLDFAWNALDLATTLIVAYVVIMKTHFRPRLQAEITNFRQDKTFPNRTYLTLTLTPGKLPFTGTCIKVKGAKIVPLTPVPSIDPVNPEDYGLIKTPAPESSIDYLWRCKKEPTQAAFLLAGLDINDNRARGVKIALKGAFYNVSARIE